jgi:protein subunit release factor B
MRTLLFSLPSSAFQWQFFCSGGPGGQNQNKRATGVRVIHAPSGASGVSRSARTQHENRKLALKHLAESGLFRIWATRYGVIEEDIETKVEAQLQRGMVKVEIKEKGRWVPE